MVVHGLYLSPGTGVVCEHCPGLVHDGDPELLRGSQVFDLGLQRFRGECEMFLYQPSDDWQGMQELRCSPLLQEPAEQVPDQGNRDR